MAEEWTPGQLKVLMDERAAADTRFQQERDRRYAEVASEREKALKIKETADLAALELAREIQTYKDEKANELREQISSERGLYVTKTELTAAVEKMEATVAPLVKYASTQQGRGAGLQSGWAILIGIIAATGTIVSVVVLLLR